MLRVGLLLVLAQLLDFLLQLRDCFRLLRQLDLGHGEQIILRRRSVCNTQRMK